MSAHFGKCKLENLYKLGVILACIDVLWVYDLLLGANFVQLSPNLVAEIGKRVIIGCCFRVGVFFVVQCFFGNYLCCQCVVRSRRSCVVGPECVSSELGALDVVNEYSGSLHPVDDS